MSEDEFNTIAWRDFIVYAWHDKSLRRAFTKSTGVSLDAVKSTSLSDYIVGGTPTTGLSAFVDWVTINHWGVESAPQKWRDEHPKAVSP